MVPKVASRAAVDFIPARYPENKQHENIKYKIITPTAPSDSASGDEDEDFQSGRETTSEAGTTSEESEEESFSESGSESSESESSSENENENESAGDTTNEIDDENKTLPHGDNQQTSFFDVNENPRDRGSRPPHRILKSWPKQTKQLCGLENQGVTCYQNAAVQAILHLPAIGQYLTEVLQHKHPKVSPQSVTYVLAELFKKLQDKKNSVFPSKLLRRLEDINPLLNEWQQEDSHEYFMSLISRLQEDSVPKGEKLRDSIIHDIFGGSVEQRVLCQRCKHVSTTSQDFYDLPVSFSAKEQSNHTLLQSIKDFFSPETIEGKGKGTSGYQCENCKHQTKATKQIAINEAPEYLTVHIKRFKMDNGSSKKVKENLAYPINMDLTEFETDKQLGPLKYKLVAVIMHEGRTVSSGHYIAFARQPNNQWMEYDDDFVKKVPESEIESNSSAYILIYSRLLLKRPQTPPKKPSKASKPTAEGKATAKSTNKKSAKSAPKPTKLKRKAKDSEIAKPSKQSKSNAKDIKSRKPKTPTPQEVRQARVKRVSRKSPEDIDQIFGKKTKKRKV